MVIGFIRIEKFHFNTRILSNYISILPETGPKEKVAMRQPHAHEIADTKSELLCVRTLVALPLIPNDYNQK